MKPSLQYDAVVIGAGVAGLTAAARLAEGGASVCVLAKGVGSTHLAAGTIDVLGYDGERVESPAQALPGFAAANPDHPYALLGPDSVGPALDWFSERVEAGPKPGYRYRGSLERNTLLPTAVGVARPSALFPETMAPGDLADTTPICFVGMPVMRDFHPSLCAANVRRLGIETRALEIDVDLGRAEANALGLARKLDDPAQRAAFTAGLATRLHGEFRVGLPAIAGLADPHGVWTDLQERLGRPVFEIPTLPPSVPGMRVYDILRAALRAAGGRLVFGTAVVGAERDGERVVALRGHTSGRDTIYGARWIVLAAGGVASGALELGSDWQARDTVLGLPLRGMPAGAEPRFRAEYFADQPMAGVGIAVDGSLLAEGTENVFVAGASLGGAHPWKEHSGEGIAITSGYAAADAILQREGSKAAA